MENFSNTRKKKNNNDNDNVSLVDLAQAAPGLVAAGTSHDDPTRRLGKVILRVGLGHDGAATALVAVLAFDGRGDVSRGRCRHGR